MNQHPVDPKKDRNLQQAIEDVLRKNGIEPNWDYSKAGQTCLYQEKTSSHDLIKPTHLNNYDGVIKTLLNLDLNQNEITEILASPNHATYSRIIRTIFIQDRFRGKYKNIDHYHLVELIIDGEQNARINIEGQHYIEYYREHRRGNLDGMRLMDERLKSTPIVRIHGRVSAKQIEDDVKIINRMKDLRVINYLVPVNRPLGGSIEIKILNTNLFNAEKFSDNLYSYLNQRYYTFEFPQYSSSFYDAHFYKNYIKTKCGIIVLKRGKEKKKKKVLEVLSEYPFTEFNVVEEHQKGWKITFETSSIYPSTLYNELNKKGLLVEGVYGNSNYFVFKGYRFNYGMSLRPITDDNYDPEIDIMCSIMNGEGEYFGY